MTLGDKQRQFSRMIAELIITAYSMGYEITLGDAYRDPRVFGKLGERKGYGRSTSLHKQRLAIDLNLFKDGRYLTTTADHAPIGEVWESMGGSWGGRYDDGNHYSFAHEGMR